MCLPGPSISPWFPLKLARQRAGNQGRRFLCDQISDGQTVHWERSANKGTHQG
jgi:hypothetical protein